MTLPRFVLGHNALIGVNHQDRAQGGPKRQLSDADRAFLTQAAALGVEGIVLDNHPVALAAARFLADNHPRVRVFPMVPYAQGVVDSVSRGGLSGLIPEMSRTALRMGMRGTLGAAGATLRGKLPEAGARVALARYVLEFPDATPGVCFLHNAVTDLMLGWGATDALRGFADACRERRIQPGFVTLNPGAIPRIADAVGDAWYMCAVNSRGIQMSPDRETAEAALHDPRHKVVAMSVLGGGILDPAVEIPRALAFPAVRSVVIGTSRISNLERLLEITAKTGGNAA